MSKQKILFHLLGLSLLSQLPSISTAQTSVAPKGTVEIPKCLVFKGNANNKDTYVPCNGVIPVGIDGNPLDWSTIWAGSSSTSALTMTF